MNFTILSSQNQCCITENIFMIHVSSIANERVNCLVVSFEKYPDYFNWFCFEFGSNYHEKQINIMLCFPGRPHDWRSLHFWLMNQQFVYSLQMEFINMTLTDWILWFGIPVRAAISNAVSPILFRWLTLAPFWSSKSTTSLWSVR